MSELPVIGITCDSETCPDTFEPAYTIKANCSSVISRTGGLPVILPIEPALSSSYLDRMDGLIITGGMFDIDPSLYGEPNRQEKLVLKKDRTGFEKKLIQGALERDMPLMGICNGMQLLAVILGAKLIQDIPGEVEACLEHMQEPPYSTPCHRVTIDADSRLYQLTGESSLNVNSIHHQSVKDLPPAIAATAASQDGVIEAIEVLGKSFCLGIQWHPEYLDQSSIFSGFIRNAIEYGQKK